MADMSWDEVGDMDDEDITEEDVEDIRPEDVAHDHANILATCRRIGCNQLWNGRTWSHDNQSDHPLLHSKAPGDTGCTVDDELTAENEPQKPDSHEYDRFGQGMRLLSVRAVKPVFCGVGMMGASYRGLAVDVTHEDREEEQKHKPIG